MNELQQQVENNIGALVSEWIARNELTPGTFFVVGCSTSEIAGEHIGSAGSEELAAVIFAGLRNLSKSTNVNLAFQCCEHLNRSLVIEREAFDAHSHEEVSAIPARRAGGAMATYAFKHMDNPVLIENIQADAGIDIGDTMIGMHLKHVAIPLRFSQKMIGKARVTGAKTRPKLIGGERAVYTNTSDNKSCK
ncbi:TIGR01440 family protein [Virgibacillus flavescens]|uniref:TIGR01440 family protein n=1 Tax=Virgibacillus flavescens TaxID=1611422 RepID=UPI003D3331A3